ncbi:MAG: DNA mismatch repair endonuclease MutL [Alistipes senegalensis]|nr:DNA mismatch repair endonuclease MutL [Bacteroides cellulosilyticus]MCM1351536.1 DNA mismatch repair endonuclease MutL [Alistipes senegalensis]
MADRIRLLSEIVANQIAAGEVVEQPASVVKEMMENALDAGATGVKVNYRNGGLELIQIVDNGCGMSPIDARMAFDRHATSKIVSADDIYALHTFGFRGEALASIAAVSQVELRTRQPEDELGTTTVLHGGKFVSQEPAMCPAGSQFFVRNLFYNVPARRRRYETRVQAAAMQIRNEFQRVALCYPETAFELYANDAPVYSLTAGTLAERIVDVVGRHIKQNLLEVAADTTIATVRGFVGRPAAAKRRPATEQFLFVNGRFFKSNYLASAVLKAYEKLIPEGTQPSYFLYLTVDPARLDVNIHPQKTEVHFADEQAVWQIVHAAVRESLAKTGAVPMMDFDRRNTVEIPVLQRGAHYDEPSAADNADYNPFREEYIDPTAAEPDVAFTGFDVPFTDEDAKTAAPRPAAKPTARPSGTSGRSHTPGIQPNTEFDDFASGGGDYDEFPSSASETTFSPTAAREITFPSTPLVAEKQDTASHLDFIPSTAPEQQQLELESDDRFGEVLPLAGGYMATTLNGRLVIVDLRRARERILYEDYLRMLQNGSAVSEQLLFPERLTLSLDEYALLESHASEFAAMGFDLDCCGDGVVEVKGTPADLPADTVDRLLYELLQAFASPVTAEEVRRDKIASLMARAGARNIPRTLSREAAADMLERLVATGNYSFSPSGKAILAEIAPEEIARHFY